MTPEIEHRTKDEIHPCQLQGCGRRSEVSFRVAPECSVLLTPSPFLDLCIRCARAIPWAVGHAHFAEYLDRRERELAEIAGIS